MPIGHKKALVAAVVAGLLAGSGAAQAMGNSPERSSSSDTAKTESKDTHGCGGANGCGGKNGCPGK